MASGRVVVRLTNEAMAVEVADANDRPAGGVRAGRTTAFLKLCAAPQHGQT
jgi:hypothetical protein